METPIYKNERFNIERYRLAKILLICLTKESDKRIGDIAIITNNPFLIKDEELIALIDANSITKIKM